MQRIFTRFVDGQARSLFQPQDWEAVLAGFSAGTAASLQAVEDDIMARDTKEDEHLPQHITGGCVWLDYHSIPQEKSKSSSFHDAVCSLPRYVERCNYFWVCAPPALHYELDEFRDFSTWRSRGWCRFEEVANLWSKSWKMPLVVSNDVQLATYGWMDRMLWTLGRPERAVGNGAFQCCHFNHELQGLNGSSVPIECDKDAIAPVLALMYEWYYIQVCDGRSVDIKSVRKCGMMRAAACLTFSGLEAQLGQEILKWQSACVGTVEEFLKMTGFDDLDAADDSGWSVLAAAVAHGSMALVKEIVARKPNLMYARTQTGASILFHAVHRPPAEFKELLFLDPRSSSLEELNYMCPNTGITAVEQAARLGFHENLRHLLALGAEIEPRRKVTGATPLLSSAEQGYPLCVEVLLSFQADIHAVDSQGRTALHLAAQPLAPIGNPEVGCKLEVLEVLLQAKAHTNTVD
eukprot:CAMPEP_0178393542 /NCGR_PEP_ID=MMETSP0689_2-20121128/12241_1 /TAXON_ID=160604 /ORGANISM="Amphidinium massartii, Strain CS-259" /LENGTH=462 /DNA_ID=CAMNT_0020014137 /DNA_START=309 /DNA_END=1694 /DNA_ORIENTATION=+